MLDCESRLASLGEDSPDWEDWGRAVGSAGREFMLK